MFIDESIITIKAGDGGNGCISFRKEKYVPKGGPDGGDGGGGGDVIFVASHDMQTLLDFKYKHIFQSENGEHGLGSKMHGKNAKPLYIKVPPGTEIYDSKTGKLLADLNMDKAHYVALEGGRGGRGNTRFTSSLRHAPRYCEMGEEGRTLEVKLVLKLIADIGLVGFPNAGKSTILSKISKATPKIANYPFTTLSPNLGVVKLAYNKIFVVADIPGIIEGAHEGAGLGNKFLKHIERTRGIVYVIDMTGFERSDPLSDLKTLQKELKSYSKKLASLPFIIAANKMDIPDSQDHYKEFIKKLRRLKAFKETEVVEISGLSGLHMHEFTEKMFELKLSSEVIKEPEPNEIEEKITINSKNANGAQSLGTPYAQIEAGRRRRAKRSAVKVDKLTTGKYRIICPELESEVKRINFKADDSLYYFKHMLKRYMIDKCLKKAGAISGDTVYIDELVFDYQDE